MIAFFVPGIPKSGQTGTVFRAGGRSFPSRRGSAWASYVALVAKEHAPKEPLFGPLSVRYRIQLQMPKKKLDSCWACVRPDYLNALKGVEDQLNGILWMDDKQLVEVHVEKIYSENPGLNICVRSLKYAAEKENG
jgi:Holliday junction resolvase RusA-like endonuclease